MSELTDNLGRKRQTRIILIVAGVAFALIALVAAYVFLLAQMFYG